MNEQSELIRIDIAFWAMLIMGNLALDRGDSVWAISFLIFAIVLGLLAWRGKSGSRAA